MIVIKTSICEDHLLMHCNLRRGWHSCKCAQFFLIIMILFFWSTVLDMGCLVVCLNFNMFVPNCTAIRPILVQVYLLRVHSKQHMSTLQCARGKVSRMHYVGFMNVFTKRHGRPFNICWDTSVWTIMVDQQTNIAVHRKKHILFNKLSFITTLD